MIALLVIAHVANIWLVIKVDGNAAGLRGAFGHAIVEISGRLTEEVGTGIR